MSVKIVAGALEKNKAGKEDEGVPEEGSYNFKTGGQRECFSEVFTEKMIFKQRR